MSNNSKNNGINVNNARMNNSDDTLSTIAMSDNSEDNGINVNNAMMKTYKKLMTSTAAKKTARKIKQQKVYDG